MLDFVVRHWDVTIPGSQRALLNWKLDWRRRPKSPMPSSDMTLCGACLVECLQARRTSRAWQDVIQPVSRVTYRQPLKSIGTDCFQM